MLFLSILNLIADRLVPCMEDDDHCHPEAYHDESHMHRVGYGMYQLLPFILYQATQLLPLAFCMAIC